MTKPLCIVAGVGPGNGAAFARKFAAEGYQVALVSRSPGFIGELAGELDDARAFSCDLTDEDQVKAVFSQITGEMGPPDTLIYNAKSIQISNVETTTLDAFTSDWQIQSAGCLLAAQAVIDPMKTAGGSIIVIGATASLKGSAGFAPFAAAKASQRMLTQSMARHLWPQGIHVAYVIVDGMVDEPRSREMAPSQPDDFFMQPDDIAQSILFLARQPKSAWTFEMDLRPFAEKW